ncbi:hypothetical protein C487_05079 [Natrinema pallidum DSM 3751]|uniref:Uncharacterized protein n=1 Tax=Natrinema pallidum DSM 3751 TaxID=1227495 RepID=L9Z1E6_9EURY|nr:hypothetical protein C487_05079 [Natrinema pallidum DSM 3751]
MATTETVETALLRVDDGEQSRRSVAAVLSPGRHPSVRGAVARRGTGSDSHPTGRRLGSELGPPGRYSPGPSRTGEADPIATEQLAEKG